MALKAQVTGQLNFVDQDTGLPVVSIDLAKAFKPITDLDKFGGFVRREILDSDNTGSPIALDMNGVVPIHGIIIYIESGNGYLTLRTDANVNGDVITGGKLLFGSFDLPTIQSTGAATIPIVFWYAFF